jgi:hypothetical protein
MQLQNAIMKDNKLQSSRGELLENQPRARERGGGRGRRERGWQRGEERKGRREGRGTHC